jgi:galactokinase
VSCDELDVLVEIARRTEGVIGARMTGGGFGGCTVNLVRRDAVDAFRTRLETEYEDATGHTPTVYVTTASDGVSEIQAP